MIGDEIRDVLHDIEENRYHYCIYGGKNLPEYMEGSDIDIIVNKIDENLLTILKNHGFIISKGKQIFTGTNFVACKFNKEYGWIPIHFITPIYFSYQICPIDFRAYRVKRDSLFFSSLELELVIIILLSLRCGYITKKRTNKVRTWSKEIDEDFLNRILHEIDKRLISVLEDQINIDFSFNKMIKKIKYYKSKLLYLKIKSKFFTKKYKAKRKGLIVTLEGIDGSGKSTFVNYLRQKVNKDNRTLFIEASMAGRGYNIFIQKTRWFWRRSCDQTGIIASIFKNTFVFVILILEILNSYFLYFRAMYKSLRGYNTMYDRYAYLHYMRQVVHNKNDFIAKETYIKLLHFFLIRTFPQPDVVVYFEIPPIIAKQRKDEELIEDLIQKKEIYRSLLYQIKSRTRIFYLDSTLKPDALVDQFLIEFWKEII